MGPTVKFEVSVVTLETVTSLRTVPGDKQIALPKVLFVCVKKEHYLTTSRRNCKNSPVRKA